MRGQPHLKVTNSLAPYDVCILTLIYFYCFDKQRIPAKIFITLISPTISTPDVNPILEKDFETSIIQRPLLPVLEPLVTYLIGADERDLAIKLVSFLWSMKSLDVVIQLLKTLKTECLTKDFRHMRKDAQDSRVRRVTKRSLIGAYLDKCLIKCQVGEFEDREALWNVLRKYMSVFQRTSTWDDIKESVTEVSFRFMPTAGQHNQDDEMFSFFQRLCQDNQYHGSGDMMIGSSHLQALLNWEIMLMSQGNSSASQDIHDILSMLTLNEITHFPAVHVFRYLESISSNCYQAAVDALHNYFDYMLTQNDENCFHISLLCLATFHARLNDCPAAIKAFEEATKVARENKDTETLNLIMIWVVDFIERNPEYSNHFQVTVDQIVKYLRSCSDSESSLVFEHAYKFESLLLMMENGSTTLVLESAFKYLVIALQRLELGSGTGSAFGHLSRIWENLGYTQISKVYNGFAQVEVKPIDEIEVAYESLSKKDYGQVARTLVKLKSPNVVYEQRKQMMLLDVRYHIALEDYSEGMKKIYQSINENDAGVVDSRWKFRFELEKCQVMLKCNVAMRGLATLTELLSRSLSTENPLQFSECLVLLCEILNEAGKLAECRSLIISNLPMLLQFPSLEEKIVEIMKVTHDTSPPVGGAFP
ncbi:anaphase promoting complex subunit 5 TDEL_0A06340 [Torulaspora delbrueckii]|uniref:Anaphase-promoting complex subunit 5 n=1 Tax=Torulaspora delbrueckii TaxID=4950 RepID=G8ZMX2_TORDE|nr:hypothetical protein TDEL_0A06340 [Torulaspora delbrueckii]CCE89966.1 hypothetical protein TDEL_0A06340 [Torulaspora delbrueckii]